MFNKFTKCKVVGDILLVCLAFAPTIYLEVYGSPAKGAYFATDESLQYTFKGETYPFWSLLVIALPVPIVLILLIETLTKGSRYRTLMTFIFGLFTSVSLMEILKYTVGRPRPIFFDWCDPKEVLLEQAIQKPYIDNYICQNARYSDRVFKTAQSTQSFPSGHASISVYALIHIALYLHFRMSSRGSHLLKYLLQFVCVTLAASVSVSRITDHMHFWSDVVVGIIIGISFAVWIVFSVSDLTKTKNTNGNLKDEVSSEV
ncbi:PPAP2A.2 family protein [Megaselia abdita]